MQSYASGLSLIHLCVTPDQADGYTATVAVPDRCQIRMNGSVQGSSTLGYELLPVFGVSWFREFMPFSRIDVSQDGGMSIGFLPATVPAGEVRMTVTQHNWVAPIWVIELLLIAWPTVVLLRRLRRGRRYAAGLCSQCGYDVRVSVDHCPECGNGM